MQNCGQDWGKHWAADKFSDRDTIEIGNTQAKESG